MGQKMTPQTLEMQLKMTGPIGNFQFLEPCYQVKYKETIKDHSTRSSIKDQYEKMCLFYPLQTVFVGDILFSHLSVCLSVFPSITLWFLLFILLDNLRNLFVFYKNVDYDKILLLYKKKGLGINSFRIISLCNS